jgi:GxxExxY protein
MSDLVLPQESYEIIGACMEVHNQMGSGFLEAVYHECLFIEFEERRIPFVSQAELPLFFKKRRLKQTFSPDFICFNQIVLEIKAVSNLVDKHRSQVINYLHATERHLGLLVNFGAHPKLEYERFARTH